MKSKGGNMATVVIVLKNADFTEGRGPMLFDNVFSSMEKAEAYVDDKKVGIFGFEPDEKFNFRLSVACKNSSQSGGWGGYEFREVELR
jgi:hypothetical protein